MTLPASLSAETRTSIATFLLEEGTRFIAERASAPDESELKPFHSRLMRVPFEAWNRWSERSFSTRTGGWFQHLAYFVAKQYHADAALGHPVTGELRNAAAAHIDEILALMDRPRPRRSPNRLLDIQEVMAVQGAGGTPRNTTSDLFVLRADGKECYYEIKTPQPNKGQCKEMKARMLLITALRHGHDVQAVGAAAYNPYEGDYAAGARGWVSQFLQVGEDFLIGPNFWADIGTPTTYDELLELSAEVGIQLNDLVEKALLKATEDDEHHPASPPSL